MAWEARRALRYGSERIGYFTTKSSAVRRARAEIEAAGRHGRITYTDDKKRIIYFDIYAEET